MQIECSPGGVWGTYLYVGETGGTIDRIDFSDARTPFATGFSLPMGIAFGPGAALNFGDFMYVSDNGANVTRKVTPAGVVSAHANITAPGSACFDPLAAYGNALFVPNVGTAIRRINYVRLSTKGDIPSPIRVVNEKPSATGIRSTRRARP